LQVLKLDTLEILDLSRNRIKILPEEIGKLKALKVLAIGRNKISRLPLSLGDLPRLQLLKFDENPLVFPPSEAYALARNNVNSSRPTNPNEQETMMTLEIKKFLRKKSKSVGNLIGIAKVQTPKESTPERDGLWVNIFSFPINTDLVTASTLQRLLELRPEIVVAKTDFRSYHPMVEA
jgi:Leucine-rich repeat (LRR) protein